jgi:uncharacterized protein Veg
MLVILDNMTVEDVRKQLNNYIGKSATIRYNLGRNKYEKYDVVIKELYSYVFLVETNNTIKSFSYSDVISKIIRVNFKEKEC